MTTKKDPTTENTGQTVEDPRGRAAFVRERHGEGGAKARESTHAADDVHVFGQRLPETPADPNEQQEPVKAPKAPKEDK